MTFATPTTKVEMYDILKQIFKYYRVQKDGYEDPEFPELSIDRLYSIGYTTEALIEMADKELKSKHLKENLERKDKLTEKIIKLESQRQSINSSTTALTTQIEEVYEKSKRSVEEQCIKNGLFKSNVLQEKLIALETEKANKISSMLSEQARKLDEIDANLTALRNSLENVNTHFYEVHRAEIYARVQEMKEELEKQHLENKKYNNALSEKEYKSHISNLNALATLKLKFYEIRSIEPTKSELVEMGYYRDVIHCVNAYYDTLPVREACQDIAHEPDLAIYLDGYYDNILYLYTQRITLVE